MLCHRTISQVLCMPKLDNDNLLYMIEASEVRSEAFEYDPNTIRMPLHGIWVWNFHGGMGWKGIFGPEPNNVPWMGTRGLEQISTRLYLVLGLSSEKIIFGKCSPSWYCFETNTSLSLCNLPCQEVERHSKGRRMDYQTISPLPKEEEKHAGIPDSGNSSRRLKCLKMKKTLHWWLAFAGGTSGSPWSGRTCCKNPHNQAFAYSSVQ